MICKYYSDWRIHFINCSFSRIIKQRLRRKINLLLVVSLQDDRNYSVHTKMSRNSPRYQLSLQTHVIDLELLTISQTAARRQSLKINVGFIEGIIMLITSQRYFQSGKRILKKRKNIIGISGQIQPKWLIISLKGCLFRTMSI